MVRHRRDLERQARREARLARRLERRSEERHLGHISHQDPTVGMAAVDG
jgi:hypothetical protein